MILRRINNWVSSVIDLRRLVSIIYFPKLIHQYIEFRSRSLAPVKFFNMYPCLSDWVSHTPFDAHYFYQGAWLARELSGRQFSSYSHVDIASDVRMISTISAFIPINFVDFRPLKADLSNLTCLAGDITNLNYGDKSIHSLSSLHVIEHIGLGRYGDPIDPDGSRRALSELSRVLAPGGLLYISLPVGKERVCFNAHRIFNPSTIIHILKPLHLISFSLINDQGEFIENASLEVAAEQDYGCGMFTFTRH